jgi:hypothetical protein
LGPAIADGDGGANFGISVPFAPILDGFERDVQTIMVNAAQTLDLTNGLHILVK